MMFAITDPFTAIQNHLNELQNYFNTIYYTAILAAVFALLALLVCVENMKRLRRIEALLVMQQQQQQRVNLQSGGWYYPQQAPVFPDSGNQSWEYPQR